MHIRLAIMLGLAACSANVAQGPAPIPVGDDAPVDASPPPPPPPPPLDATVIAIDASVDAGGPLAPPAHGFQIATPSVDIDPQADVTYCYYFRTRNTSELAIQKWASRMTEGSQLIVYLTQSDLEAPGTLSTRDCGFRSGGSGLVWTYAADTIDDQLVLPPDDGAGTPVGQIIKSGQSGFIQMHFVNTTSEVIHAHVELNAYAYPDDVRVTQAVPFVTYSTTLSLSPGSAAAPKPGVASGSCTVSPDAKFYFFSTHTHKQGVHTFVKDGSLTTGATVFDSTSWEHPGEQTWNAAPFFSFASGKLSYQCEYMNPTNRVILAGDNAATDELCMAVGYFFPAVAGKGHLCADNNIVY